MDDKRVTVIDYGLGNFMSVVKMLDKIGAEVNVATEGREILNARKLILPGVGSYDRGITRLEERGLARALKEAVLEKRTPVLGICLGMQLFSTSSEEGSLDGLGFLDEKVVRFEGEDFGARLKVPHMGWNTVEGDNCHFLFKGMPSPMRFYFAHSFYYSCRDQGVVIGTTEYGHRFPSVIGRDNILGVQFHPEKSHIYGMTLLRNYAELC